MGLDATPAAAAAAIPANATAEHEAAGGNFDEALAAAMADDAASGETPEQDAADVNAPAPDAEAKADKSEDETPVEKPKAEPKKEGPPDAVKAKLRDELRAEIKTELKGEFSALARDRSKIKEREQAAVATEQRAQAHVQKAQAYDVLIKRIMDDPAGLVFEAGGDPLVSKLLDGVVAREKSPAEREVARMRAELDERDRKAAEATQLATIDRWKDTVRTAVAADESFDLINSLGQHDAVIATIEAYYVKHNGAILPVADAAQAVEDILSRGLAKSKKFGARAPATNAQPSKGNPAPSGRKPGSVTLSSVHSSEVPAGAEDDLPLDPADRFRRVMAGLG